MAKKVNIDVESNGFNIYILIEQTSQLPPNPNYRRNDVQLRIVDRQFIRSRKKYCRKNHDVAFTCWAPRGTRDE